MEEYLENIKAIFDKAHADLSPEEFINLVQAVEEDLWTQRDKFDEEVFIKNQG
jgi:hypothetical protein